MVHFVKTLVLNKGQSIDYFKMYIFLNGCNMHKRMADPSKSFGGMERHGRGMREKKPTSPSYESGEKGDSVPLLAAR